MLLKEHALQEVTVAVEQAAGLGLYDYEAVTTFLGGETGQATRHRLAGVAQPGGAL